VLYVLPIISPFAFVEHRVEDILKKNHCVCVADEATAIHSVITFKLMQQCSESVMRPSLLSAAKWKAL